MNCTHKGCRNEAVCVPALNIPAEDWPIDMHRPMRMIMGIHLCNRHYETFTGEQGAGDAIAKRNPELVEIVAVMARGKQPPDWPRAFFSKCKLTSEEYRTFEKTRGQGPG